MQLWLFATSLFDCFFDMKEFGMNVLIPPAWRTFSIWIAIIGIAISQGFGDTSTGNGDFCTPWVTYRDPNTGACVPCSRCPEGYMAATMCEFDRDTLCTPATDLGKHIESVVRHKIIESVEASVDPSWVHSSAVKQMKSKEEEVPSPKEDTSPFIILAICLSVALIISIIFAVVCIAKNCRRKEVEPNPLDPLKRGLLLDQDDHGDTENEKPPMDLDELLAVRYGRSLVTNNYIL